MSPIQLVALQRPAFTLPPEEEPAPIGEPRPDEDRMAFQAFQLGRRLMMIMLGIAAEEACPPEFGPAAWHASAYLGPGLDGNYRGLREEPAEPIPLDNWREAEAREARQALDEILEGVGDPYLQGTWIGEDSIHCWRPLTEREQAMIGLKPRKRPKRKK
jgi:hypothetical protein